MRGLDPRKKCLLFLRGHFPIKQRLEARQNFFMGESSVGIEHWHVLGAERGEAKDYSNILPAAEQFSPLSLTHMSRSEHRKTSPQQTTGGTSCAESSFRSHFGQTGKGTVKTCTLGDREACTTGQTNSQASHYHLFHERQEETLVAYKTKLNERSGLPMHNVRVRKRKSGSRGQA